MPMGREIDEYDLIEAEYIASERRSRSRVFDESLLEEPLSEIPTAPPIVCAPGASVTEAMRAMQAGRRGCVVITADGTAESRLDGIFSERDVLLRVVDRGRNPVTLPLREVMTPDPECLPAEAPIAWVLNRMALGGFRHVPIVDDEHRPVGMVSVRDVVQFLVDFFPRRILNLPPEYGSGPVRTREGA